MGDHETPAPPTKSDRVYVEDDDSAEDEEEEEDEAAYVKLEPGSPIVVVETMSPYTLHDQATPPPLVVQHQATPPPLVVQHQAPPPPLVLQCQRFTSGTQTLASTSTSVAVQLGL